MYESLCLGTKNKCPLSALTGVRVKRVYLRNCPLYMGVRIKRVFRLAEIKILCLSSNYW